MGISGVPVRAAGGGKLGHYPTLRLKILIILKTPVTGPGRA